MRRRGPGACAGMRGALAWAVPAVVSLAAAPAAGAADAVSPAYPAGFGSFQANCAVCHGPAGAGIPGLAPPLDSYPAHYAGSAEGRRQLAMTVLNGLYGEITVGDKRFDFRMPEFSALDDATLAAVLNFVVFDLGHAAPATQPIAVAEILAERSHPVDGAVVREHRKTVVPAGS
jgi:mono/diheme cytochrome c family protein